MTPADILKSGAATFEERGKIYGDNYLRIGAVLSALFPHGIEFRSDAENNRYHLFMMILVKLTRLAIAMERGGTHLDSIHDIMVYAAMWESLDYTLPGEP